MKPKSNGITSLNKFGFFSNAHGY